MALLTTSGMLVQLVWAASSFVVYFMLGMIGLGSLPASCHVKDWYDGHIVDMTGQIAVITGCNTGVGYQTACELGCLGATVIMACRSESKASSAANSLAKEVSQRRNISVDSARHQFVILELDLSDLSSILHFTDMVKSRFSRIDYLINNAGLSENALLSTRLSQLFQVNFLGHLLLVRSLADLLTSSTGSPSDSSNFSSNVPSVARVINLSSVMHHVGQPNFLVSAKNQFRALRNSSGYSAYADSKLYMNFLTLHLNRIARGTVYDRLLSPIPLPLNSSSTTVSTMMNENQHSTTRRRVVAISVNPGAVSSDIWRHSIFRRVYDALSGNLFLDTKHGCATSVYAATVPWTKLAERLSMPVEIDGTPLPPFLRRVGAHCKLMESSDLPYVVPYDMSGRRTGVASEMFGRFAGPSFAGVSFPKMPMRVDLSSFRDSIVGERCQLSADTIDNLASQLWEFSLRTGWQTLEHSGISQEKLECFKL